MFRTFETTLAGRPLVIETGKMAQLANGHSCTLRRHSCNGKRNSVSFTERGR